MPALLGGPSSCHRRSRLTISVFFSRGEGTAVRASSCVRNKRIPAAPGAGEVRSPAPAAFLAAPARRDSAVGTSSPSNVSSFGAPWASPDTARRRWCGDGLGLGQETFPDGDDDDNYTGRGPRVLVQGSTNFSVILYILIRIYFHSYLAVLRPNGTRLQ